MGCNRWLAVVLLSVSCTSVKFTGPHMEIKATLERDGYHFTAYLRGAEAPCGSDVIWVSSHQISRKMAECSGEFVSVAQETMLKVKNCGFTPVEVKIVAGLRLIARGEMTVYRGSCI